MAFEGLVREWAPEGLGPGAGGLRPRVLVAPDAPALMAAAAQRVLDLAGQAIALRGRFTWALAGGSTPRGLYAALAPLAAASGLDWAKVHFFWGDERCVPPDDPRSNYRMARESLLDRVGPPAGNVHRWLGEADPPSAAERYEAQLRGFFGADAAPRFDLALLGLGPDGHTASLFPGSPALDEQHRWALAVHPPQVGAWRLTLTPPVLLAADAALFLVAGREKAERLGRILRGPPSAPPLPAESIGWRQGPTEFYVDAAAAAQLGPFETP
jgi:6-phosphogluconolactonase